MVTTTPRHLVFSKPSRGEAVRSSLHTALLRPCPQPPPKRTYKTKEAEIRGSVRTKLDASLADTSGVPDAKMRWGLILFRDYVAVPFGVVLHGWPPEFPFDNLSNKGAPGMKAMRKLLQLLTASPPELYFVKATTDQLRAALYDAKSICPGPLFPAPKPRLSYNNIGKRKPVYDKHGDVIPLRYARDGPKTAQVVPEEVEAMVDGEVQTGPKRELLPQIHTRWGVRLGWQSSGYRVLSLGMELEEDPIQDANDEIWD